MKTGLLNALLRMTGLGARFVLAIYMARYMSIRDVGIWALMTGLVGLLPSISGFGLNYFVARAIVHQDGRSAILMSRDRLVVSFCVSLTAGLIIAALIATGLVDLPIALPLLLAIVVLEVMGFDIQMMLLARRRSTFANMQLFLRTGCWVIPFIAASWLVPTLRTIDALCSFWLAGLVASYVLVLARYRSRLGVASQERPDVAALKPFLRKAPKIYMADLGLAGSVYLDRFVVSNILSIEAAGIYFFFTSIINAVYTICLASTTQVYAPDFRAAYMRGGLDALNESIGHRMRHTIGIAFTMLGLALPASYLVAHLLHKPQLLANTAIIPLVTAAYAAKVLSEFMSAVIAAAERDTEYAAFNVAGLVLTVAFCSIGTWSMGLVGTAAGLLAASCVMAGLRFLAWRRLRGATHRLPPELAS